MAQSVQNSVNGLNSKSNDETSPNSVYLLHVIAGCNTIVSMETAKYLLDSGRCDVNDQEPQDLLTPLHIAASWDNLLMCQLLVHYGADLMAMDRDKCTPTDLAKGSSRDFLRKIVKRGEKRRRRKIFKFLRHLFQPHKTKSKTPIPRSATTQCIPSPAPKPNLNQQIDDYLLNADQYNKLLSGKRFSGFVPANDLKMDAPNSIDVSKRGNLEAMSSEHYARTSSLSSYKTASDELVEDLAEMKLDNQCFPLPQRSNDENSQPSTHFPNANVPFSSLYPVEQLKDLSSKNLTSVNVETPKISQLRTKPEPSAPPLTPQITMRRPKPKIQCQNFDQNETPTAMPRSTSLCDAIVPRNISTTACSSKDANLAEDNDVNANTESLDDPILNELTAKAAQLSLDQLKARLKRHVFSPGPLDNTNRRLYERKLAVLDLNAMRGVEYEMKRKQMGFRYSVALERLIKAEDLSEKFLIGLLEEQLIQEEFKDSRSDISFFCYLLVDITDLLPNPSFRDFIKAIFYIGKGKRSRPLCHFADAIKHRQNPKGVPSSKIEHIGRVWDQGMGIVSLHLFNNISSDEALIREGSMIEAMLLDNLDNAQRGTFSGVSKTWSTQRKAEFGAFLLKKAYNIYQNERCRPIFEQDVVDLKLW